MTTEHYKQLWDHIQDVLQQTKLYDNIAFLQITFASSEYIIDQCINIKKNLKPGRTCIVLKSHEALSFELTSKIPNEFLYIIDGLKQANIFDTDIIHFLGFSDSSIDAFKVLNQNSYGWRFKNIEVNTLLFTLQKKAKWLDPFGVKLDTDNFNLDLSKAKYKISHVNFTHRMHRQLFSKFLLKNKLVKNNLVSIRKHKPMLQEIQEDCTQEEKKINKYSSRQPGTLAEWFYDKTLLDLWQSTPLEYVSHPDSGDSQIWSTNHPYIANALVNVISETMYAYPYRWLTEKTFIPMLQKRPFLLIGSPGTLNFLKSRGFKTFDKIFDESYDNITDHNTRLHTLMNMTKKITEIDQTDLTNMVKSVEDELQHNYSLAVSMIKNLKKNLESSIIKYVN